MFYLLFLFLFLFPQSVKATKEYRIDYQSNYQILPNDTVYVQHQIKLTNNLANIYPTNYTISIGTINLNEIKVSVNKQSVKPKIDLGPNYTTISFPIANPQIGRDKTNLIHINYFNSNVLEKIGHNYEINLPKLSKANEANTYLRILSFPTTFPTHYLAIPKPSRRQQLDNRTILTWTNSPNQAITLLFGRTQTYKLELTYQLQSGGGQTTEIALPLDTPYQRVFLEKIEPQPQFIDLDHDGNWLAHYQLDQLKTKQVKAILFVQVYPQPVFNLPSSNQDFHFLTKPTRFWPSHQPEIKLLAQRLKTPYNIYDYLVNNFVYNYHRSTKNQRLGAVQALKNPQLAICTEFTDTFIALARSLQIPAREINGYAYTHNRQLKPLDLTQDVLHAWPEYLDPKTKTWLEIDPTWGNTTNGLNYFYKLDFNHIAFVRHGQEDNYPLPAGAYKNNPHQKDIKVTPVDQPPQPKETYILKDHQLINTGNLALVNKTIKLANGQSIKIAYLPPYGHLSLNQAKPILSGFHPLAPLLLLIPLAILVLFFLRYVILKP